MLFADTIFLLRYLTNDDPTQADAMVTNGAGCQD